MLPNFTPVDLVKPDIPGEAADPARLPQLPEQPGRRDQREARQRWPGDQGDDSLVGSGPARPRPERLPATRSTPNSASRSTSACRTATPTPTSSARCWAPATCPTCCVVPDWEIDKIAAVRRRGQGAVRGPDRLPQGRRGRRVPDAGLVARPARGATRSGVSGCTPCRSPPTARSPGRCSTARTSGRGRRRPRRPAWTSCTRPARSSPTRARASGRSARLRHGADVSRLPRRADGWRKKAGGGLEHKYETAGVPAAAGVHGQAVQGGPGPPGRAWPPRAPTTKTAVQRRQDHVHVPGRPRRLAGHAGRAGEGDPRASTCSRCRSSPPPAATRCVWGSDKPIFYTFIKKGLARTGSRRCCGCSTGAPRRSAPRSGSCASTAWRASTSPAAPTARRSRPSWRARRSPNQYGFLGGRVPAMVGRARDAELRRRTAHLLQRHGQVPGEGPVGGHQAGDAGELLEGRSSRPRTRSRDIASRPPPARPTWTPSSGSGGPTAGTRAGRSWPRRCPTTADDCSMTVSVEVAGPARPARGQAPGPPSRRDGAPPAPAPPRRKRGRRPLRARLRRDWPLLVMIAPAALLVLRLPLPADARQRHRVPGLQPVGRRQSARRRSSTASGSASATSRRCSATRRSGTRCATRWSIHAFQLVFFFPLPIVLAILLNSVLSGTAARLHPERGLPAALLQLGAGGHVLRADARRRRRCSPRSCARPGLQPWNIMTNPDTFIVLVTAEAVWKDVGWGTIVFLAALSAIDHEPVRGGRGGRRGPLAPAVAHHPARPAAGHRAAADPAPGRRAQRRLRAVHPAARRGRPAGGRGARHVRLLQRRSSPSSGASAPRPACSRAWSGWC